MKRLFFLLAIGMAVACRPGSRSVELISRDWDPQVRCALNELLEAKGHQDAYAVFDFDKTSITHDVSQALWVYQVEHLRYCAAPEHAFLDGIPDTSLRLGDETLAQIGFTLQEEYAQLTELRKGGKTLEQIHATDLYKDFRARMAALLAGMDGLFGYEVSYLWMPGLLAGYTPKEAREVVHDAILNQMGKDKLAVEDWTSPDGKWSEKVERGIYFPPEIKDLYRCLAASGIKPYVCSASLELIVEVLACDPELGVGLPPEQVFGLRFVPGETLVPQYDPTYVQTIKDGKVSCINTWMAPNHNGSAPVLVGGDSNGDVPMLTAYPTMVHGLILDVGRSPESAIGKLAAKARAEGNKGLYILQPAFGKAGGSIDGGGI